MKKLILIALMAISIIGSAQQFARNYTIKNALPVYTVDGDTSFTFSVPSAPIIFTSDVQWYGLDQTDGSVKIQYSMKDTHPVMPPDSTFVDYDMTPDSLLLNTANGVAMLEDMWQGTSARWIRWKVDSGTCTAGSLELNVNLITKR